jgi:peroxiredoxin
MRRLVLPLLAVAAMLSAQQGNEPQPLKVGDMAPDFSLPATTGGKISLSSYRGKSPVVLAFFPAAFTGG